MAVWCAVLFLLGVGAFLDSTFTFGEIFRRINSILFMLVSLGLLVRIKTKIKQAQAENLQGRLAQSEAEVKRLSQSKKTVLEPKSTS